MVLLKSFIGENVANECLIFKIIKYHNNRVKNSAYVTEKDNLKKCSFFQQLGDRKVFIRKEKNVNTKVLLSNLEPEKGKPNFSLLRCGKNIFLFVPVIKEQSHYIARRELLVVGQI